MGTSWHWRNGALLWLLLILPGCGTELAAMHAAPTALGPATQRQSLCVASGIGGTFKKTKIGFTVFGNEFGDVAIPGWGLDAVATNKVKAVMSARADVHVLEPPPGTFENLRPHVPFSGVDDPLVDAIAKIAALRRCDLYLLVVRGYSKVGTTNIFVSGIGSLETPRVFGPRKHLHATFALRLYDGKTLALRVAKVASIGQPTFMETLRGPHIDLDNAYDLDPVRIAGDGKTRDAIRKLVEDGIAFTLPQVIAPAAS